MLYFHKKTKNLYLKLKQRNFVKIDGTWRDIQYYRSLSKFTKFGRTPEDFDSSFEKVKISEETVFGLLYLSIVPYLNLLTLYFLWDTLFEINKKYTIHAIIIAYNIVFTIMVLSILLNIETILKFV